MANIQASERSESGIIPFLFLSLLIISTYVYYFAPSLIDPRFDYRYAKIEGATETNGEILGLIDPEYIPSDQRVVEMSDPLQDRNSEDKNTGRTQIDSLLKDIFTQIDSLQYFDSIFQQSYHHEIIPDTNYSLLKPVQPGNLDSLWDAYLYGIKEDQPLEVTENIYSSYLISDTLESYHLFSEDSTEKDIEEGKWVKLHSPREFLTPLKAHKHSLTVSSSKEIEFPKLREEKSSPEQKIYIERIADVGFSLIPHIDSVDITGVKVGKKLPQFPHQEVKNLTSLKVLSLKLYSPPLHLTTP